MRRVWLIPTTAIAVVDATYYVSQTANGCEGPRLAIKSAGPCLGTDDLKIAELNYYPNPVSDQLTITTKDAVTRVEVYNLLGQQLSVLDASSNHIQIDFNTYAPSTYLIRVYSQAECSSLRLLRNSFL